MSPGSTGDPWTCHKETLAGELALLYVTQPFSEVRWLLRAKPVTYQELRQDQQLARWDAINRNLHGKRGSWVVPSSHWERLRRRLVGRNPETGPSFE